MNSLPSHRQLINGRTFRQQWNPADFDPVERISRRTEAGLGVLLACVIGILGAVVLVHWWSI